MTPTRDDLKSEQIIQVAYDETLVTARAVLVASRGYTVVSALGNVEAKRLLNQGGRIASSSSGTLPRQR